MWGIFYPKKGNILYFSKRGKVPFTGSKNSLDKSLEWQMSMLLYFTYVILLARPFHVYKNF